MYTEYMVWARARWLRCREFIPRDAKRFHSGDRKISITQRAAAGMCSAQWQLEKSTFACCHIIVTARCLPRVAGAACAPGIKFMHTAAPSQ